MAHTLRGDPAATVCETRVEGQPQTLRHVVAPAGRKGLVVGLVLGAVTAALAITLAWAIVARGRASLPPAEVSEDGSPPAPQGKSDPAAAREAYERGKLKLAQRRIAPRNLYDAWKAFSDARRRLEGVSPRPPLYDEVAQLAQDCEQDLGRQCGRLLFTAARFARYGDEDRAQDALRDVLRHFPGDEPSGCRARARENLVSRPDEAQ